MLKDKYSRFRFKKKYLLFYILVILGLVLLYLPKDYFDTGQSVCVSMLLLNKQCYGCGMTRGIQHLIHLDFERAFAFNKLSFIVLPLFLFLIIKEFIRVYKREDKMENHK